MGFMRPDAYASRWDTTVGTDFEDNFIFALDKVYKNMKAYHVDKYTGTKMDKEQGTDCILRDSYSEIRIDPTLNFSHKNYMPYIAESDIRVCGGQNLWFGVRHGNHHNYKYNGFDEPVIVIGINMDPKDYKANDYTILKNLEKNMDEIVTFAYDCLDDYNTTNVEERKDLPCTPLRRNPNYRPPKRNLKQRYADIENFRQQYVDNEKGHATHETCVHFD